MIAILKLTVHTTAAKSVEKKLKIYLYR
eukprot:UN19914